MEAVPWPSELLGLRLPALVARALSCSMVVGYAADKQRVGVLVAQSQERLQPPLFSTPTYGNVETSRGSKEGSSLGMK